MTERAEQSNKKTLDLVKAQVEFAKKLLDRESDNAEGCLITCHFVKNGRIVSSRVYENWPIVDWGTAMIYIGCEAKAAKLLVESGGAN